MLLEVGFSIQHLAEISYWAVQLISDYFDELRRCANSQGNNVGSLNALIQLS